jgi:hypothetical protein
MTMYGEQVSLWKNVTYCKALLKSLKKIDNVRTLAYLLTSAKLEQGYSQGYEGSDRTLTPMPRYVLARRRWLMHFASAARTPCDIAVAETYRRDTCRQ